VLVRPEDVLEAVRASILMGAVLPELRDEAQVLALDLQELVRLRAQIDQDRTALTAELAALIGERQRIEGLIGARRDRETAALRNLESEQQRAAQLGRESGSLRELMDQLEREITAAAAQAEQARRQAEAQTRETRERMAALAFRDPARLQPQALFQDLRGRLPAPVAGSQSRGFGAPDGAGGTARGASFTGRPGALVSAPADGWVVFSGPFRSFGHMVILQMGGGYHVLLAGMRRTDVARGQFVLAGEPVGALGDAAEGSAVALGDGNGEPILYVEFRRDGQSIDPGPWWAATQGGRVRG
jgi:murein hydrolase activator